jgi:hypothetical protein
MKLAARKKAPSKGTCPMCGLPVADPVHRGWGPCGSTRPSTSIRVPRAPQVPNDMAITVRPKRGTPDDA